MIRITCRKPSTLRPEAEWNQRLAFLWVNWKHLGQERQNFTVIAYTLPPTATIDGLLGLDFFRNHVLTIDFQNGEITLT
jgi:hypothetical protein